MINEVSDYFSVILADLVDNKRRECNPIKTIESIAEEIGISKGALSQYINGKREPKISTLFRIATYFNVSPNTLLGYKSPQEKNTLPLEIHAYSGLSTGATEVLHQKKDDTLFMPVLNYLLEDCNHDAEASLFILEDIAEYMTSDLWDDLAKDERYNTLPGTAHVRATERGGKTSEEIRRECLLDIQEEFPIIRDALYSNILCCDEQTKRAYVSTLAMKNIQRKTVLDILYPPYVAKSICEMKSVSMDDIDKIETVLQEVTSKDHPELADFDVLPATFCDLSEYDEFTAAPNEYCATLESKSFHRKQALGFIKEYIARYGKI